MTYDPSKFVQRSNQWTSPAGNNYDKVRQQIAQAMEVNWKNLSIVYIGRDTNNRPMYRTSYTLKADRYLAKMLIMPKHSQTVTRVNTYTWDGKNLDKPFIEEQHNPAAGGDSLRTLKDTYISRIASFPTSGQWGVSKPEQERAIKMVNDWKGTPQQLNEYMRFFLPNLEGSGQVGELVTAEQSAVPDWWNLLGGGGGGRGSGMRPQYAAPDRRVVEDMVKGMQVSLLGAVHEDQIKAMADLYMKDHRRNFDSSNQEISPEMSVLEMIRNTQSYQEIHALRPESEDERTWISQRRNAAAQGGLNVDRQEGFAIQQATAGGDVRDVADAASATQFHESGSAQGTLIEDKLKDAAQAVFTGVRR